MEHETETEPAKVFVLRVLFSLYIHTVFEKCKGMENGDLLGKRRLVRFMGAVLHNHEVDRWYLHPSEKSVNNCAGRQSICIS